MEGEGYPCPTLSIKSLLVLLALQLANVQSKSAFSISQTVLIWDASNKCVRLSGSERTYDVV